MYLRHPFQDLYICQLLLAFKHNWQRKLCGRPCSPSSCWMTDSLSLHMSKLPFVKGMASDFCKRRRDLCWERGSLTLQPTAQGLYLWGRNFCLYHWFFPISNTKWGRRTPLSVRWMPQPAGDRSSGPLPSGLALWMLCFLLLTETQASSA